MPPLVVTRPVPLRPPPSRPRRLFRATIAAVACLHAAWAGELRAQSSLTHTDDAIPIPGGWFRFTVGSAWTRYDSRFGENGALRGLGEEFSTDSLGARQLPLLGPVESALRTLTKDPAQRLTFGRLDVRSDARIVTTPFALEYGITRRLSFGVLVPLVQTRRSAQVRVNQRATGDTTKTSNVGVLAATDRLTQATLNAKLVADLTKAASSLSALLTRCALNSAAAECDPVRGREADARDAAQRATDFANAVVAAYGITEATAVVAPLKGSALATSVESERAALATKLAAYVPGTLIGTLPTATTEFSYVDLQGQFGSPGLLQGRFGGGLDSIATTDRIGFGDIELRARVLLLDHGQRDTLPMRGVAYRLAVGGIVRFATSRPDSANDLLDIATGDGAGVEVRTALDVSAGRVGATIAGRFAKSSARTQKVALAGNPIGGFPNPVFGEVSRTAGDVFGLDVTPRFFVGDWLAFEGLFGFERTGAATITGSTESPCSACVALASSVLPAEVTVQRVGAGIRYSTVDSFLRGRAKYPVEVSYRHLETITGDEGAPKLFRDQIQLRIYYRLWR
jgi:hypothetical protein